MKKRRLTLRPAGDPLLPVSTGSKAHFLTSAKHQPLPKPMAPESRRKKIVNISPPFTAICNISQDGWSIGSFSHTPICRLISIIRRHLSNRRVQLPLGLRRRFVFSRLQAYRKGALQLGFD